MVESLHKGKIPKPAPRQFVTVVSVGEINRLEVGGERMTTTAVVETSLKLRLDVPGDIADEERIYHNHHRRRHFPPSEIAPTNQEEPMAMDTSEPTQIPDQVVVFRLPGERLGLGLKFDGGTTVSETVKRLFIQSVAPDSPAARASVPWGDLEIGDQILHIEGKLVTSMTRVECVSRLKEASVKLTIGVLRGNGVIPDTDVQSPPILGTKPAVSIVGGRIKRIPPPPIPPRSMARKSPARPPKDINDLPPPPHGFDDLDDEPGSKVARMYQPSNYPEDYESQNVTYMSSSHHRHVARLPPAPAVYLDLFSEEEKLSRARCESESDETNSSVSTVIDRLSISSSRTVSRNSSFNAAADAAKFDLARALSPFESLEKEMNTEKRPRSLSTPHLTYSESFSPATKSGAVELSSPSDDQFTESSTNVKQSPKSKVKTTLKSFSFSMKSRPFSWHTSKQEDQACQTDGLYGSSGSLTKKGYKRQAPMPPSPRSTKGNSSNGYTSATIDELRSDFFQSEMDYDDQDVFESEDPLSIVEVSSGEIFCTDPFSEKVDRVVVAEIEEDAPTVELTKLRYVDNKCYEHAEKMSATAVEDGVDGYLVEDEDTRAASAEEPLNANYALYAVSDEPNEEEPLESTETYECKKLFFIDHATNPSYGLSSPLLDGHQSSSSVPSIEEDLENQEDYYEEIDSAPVAVDANATKKGLTGGNFDELHSSLSSSSPSLNSSFSISSTSLSSRELEELKAEEREDEDKLKVTFDSEVVVETEDEYEYVTIDDLKAKVNQSQGSSTRKFCQVSRDVRLRKDLCELLKKDLQLSMDAQVEIEEEEVVESFVECQSEEEILLVLRALRSDNSFSLGMRCEDDDKDLKETVQFDKDEKLCSLQDSKVSSSKSDQQKSVTEKVIDSVISTSERQRSCEGNGHRSDSQDANHSTGLNLLKDDSYRTCNVSTRPTARERFGAIVDPNSIDVEHSSKSLSEVLLPSTQNYQSQAMRNFIKMVAYDSEPSLKYSDRNRSSDSRSPNTISLTGSSDDDDSVSCDHSLTSASPTEEDDLGVVIAVPQSIYSHDSKTMNKNSPFLHTTLENVIEEQEEPPASPPSLVIHLAEEPDELSTEEEDSGSPGDFISLSPVPEHPRDTDDQGGTNSVTLYEQRCSTTKTGRHSSPPSYSRLPPDGHEFPACYTEGMQEKLSRLPQFPQEENNFLDSTASPSTLPKATSTRASSTSRWRRQDERSEKSVRDKIAMFSSEKAAAAKKKNIHRSESVSSTSSDKVCMKRSLTEDDVRIQSIDHDSKSAIDLPDQITKKMTKPSVYSSMINVNTTDSESKENVKPASSETDISRERTCPRISRIESHREKKGSDKPETKREVSTSLNNRSQSLVDIGKPARMKRHSVGAYDRPIAYKYGVEKPEERERRTSLTNMIEQRRKSMSKLRGLVIPEARTGESTDRLPIDLPKIGSNASLTLKTMSLPRDESRISRLYKADSVSSIDSCSSSTSRHSTVNKYSRHSPANNRKSSLGTTKNDSLPPLSYRINRNHSPMSDFSGPTSTPRTASPQRHSERALTPNSDGSFENDSKYTSERTYVKHSFTRKNSFDSRLTKNNDDSDNDSAVSSTQSSFSQSLSPRASPMPDHYDADDGQSSRIHHSPQSSFDELDPKRVLKNGTIEAENRRNILNSAKCSSGRSSDEYSTPELVRKYPKGGSEPQPFPDRLDSDLRESKKKTRLSRKGSVESNTSGSSQESRRNSRDTLTGHEDKVSVEQVYVDRQGEIYKNSQVKVAYLNEIVDDFEEINDSLKEDVIVGEIPLSIKTPILKTNVNVTTHVDTKWSALEQKYSKLNDHESFENKMQKYTSPHGSLNQERNRSGVTTKKTNFKAVADKWKQLADEDPTPYQPNAARRDSITRPDKPSIKREDNVDSVLNSSRSVKKVEESSFTAPSNSFFEERPTSLNLTRPELPDRKFSVPEFGTSLKMREKRESSNEVSSRPTSLIEGNTPLDPLQPDCQYMTPLSPSSTSTDSRDELLDSSDLSRTGSKEVLDAFSKPCLNNSQSPKISDIMRAFERHDMNVKAGFHPRMSSLDSTGSDDGSQGAHYGSVSSLTSGTRDQYGSITSLSSSTSIISSQELQQLIEEANYSLEESGTPSHEILVVVLHREIVGHGSIGITLAGGADYETKEITVNRVIPGSLSDRDGRIQKGDRVLSINGKTLRGVSHREALNILKSPRPEVVLVLSRSRSVTPQESTMTASNGDVDGGFSHRPVFINHVPPPRPPKILESPMDSKSLVSDTHIDPVPRGPPRTVSLVKDGAGLGFSLEGGKDSPLGDRPLTVKKIFTGGAADKGGILVVGDELLSVNSIDLTYMARIEAWNFLKKLPDGTVLLVIRKILKEEPETPTSSSTSSDTPQTTN